MEAQELVVLLETVVTLLSAEALQTRVHLVAAFHCSQETTLMLKDLLMARKLEEILLFALVKVNLHLVVIFELRLRMQVLEVRLVQFLFSLELLILACRLVERVLLDLSLSELPILTWGILELSN